MSMKSLIGFLTLVVALAGCATVEAPVKPLDQADPASAYLYGNFFTEGLGKAAIALEIKNVATQETHLIKFRRDRRIVVNKVPPGRYIMQRSLGLSLGNQMIGPPQPLMVRTSNIAFDVLAGRAYYLGDYQGQAGITGLASTSVGGTYATVGWEVSSVDDSFAQTNEMLKKFYPELRALPTERVFKPY